MPVSCSFYKALEANGFSYDQYRIKELTEKTTAELSAKREHVVCGST